MVRMSILKYLHSVKQKPDLPDPNGPLRKAVPLTAISAANEKVNESLNEVEVKEKFKEGPQILLISDISTQV